MAAQWLYPLITLHTLAAVFWLGVLMYSAGFVIPAIRNTGPAGGEVMRYIVQTRRLPVFMNLAVLSTMLSGGALYWLVSGGLAPAWLTSPHGIAMSIGALLTIATALIGRFVNVPTAARLAALGVAIRAGKHPPTPEQRAAIQRYQAKLANATTIGACLLSATAVAMTLGRYL